jgi:hypothetical protein
MIISEAPSNEPIERSEHCSEDGEEGVHFEVHEFFGNLLVLVVGLHVTYLLLYQTPRSALPVVA